MRLSNSLPIMLRRPLPMLAVGSSVEKKRLVLYSRPRLYRRRLFPRRDEPAGTPATRMAVAAPTGPVVLVLRQ